MPDAGQKRHSTQRRRLLQGAAAATFLRPGKARAADATLRLRLLETSDLHMFVDDYDYYRDQPDETVGLAKTASLIAEARGQAPNSLLFDNGDLIQGNPLADYMALRDRPAKGGVHPMFKAMNLLGYDAATVGNHEFNYGLPFLDAALQGPNFPFVCANILRPDGSNFLPPWIVLERDLVDDDGGKQRLKIGVIGFVTPQITVWDRSALAGRLTTVDIVDAARRHVPDLRNRSDVVVALCHSGISTTPRTGGDENAAFHLASVPGIDAIFTGHAHRVFPGPDYAGCDGVDAARGTLAGVPAVMPGFWGSHLGIIDLRLRSTGGAWSVADFRVEARPIYRRDGGTVVPLVAAEPRVVASIAAENQAAIDYMRQPVGTASAPITSYFALIGDDPTVATINAAQLWYLKPLLAGTRHEGLPLLSAAAPFKAGGMGGPGNYTDIPAGPIALKNIADLYIFPNTLRAVRITGAQVKEWLERAAGIFNRLDPHDPAQSLIDPHVPSYNFDVVQGVTYGIDVTRPRRYAADGTIADLSAERIVDLRAAGLPIDPSAEFIVATNNYRADGGGRFPGLDGSMTVLEAPDMNRDAIVRYVEAGLKLPPDNAGTWRFAGKFSAVFETSPMARLELAIRPALRDLGNSATGFARFSLTLA